MDGIQEIRVPISEHSISRYCARYGKLLNVTNAYDEDELTAINPKLTFDRSWDVRTGFQTQQVLAVSLLFERKYLMGVFILLNNNDGDKFSTADEEKALEIAELLGVAFRNQQHRAKRRFAAPKSKFDYLIETKLISRDDLETAMTEARRKGIDVETQLIDEYRLPKKEIGESLSRYFKCPFLEFDERSVPEPALIKGINFDYLKANYWVPLRREEDTVDILVDDPKNLQKTEHIQILMKGLQLKFFVGLRKDILQYLYSASEKHDLLDNILTCDSV